MVMVAILQSQKPISGRLLSREEAYSYRLDLLPRHQGGGVAAA